MKKIILLFAGILPLCMFAQSTGEITYEDKVNMHRRLTGERERFKEFVPEFRSTHKTLLFSEAAALYTTAKKQPEENVPEVGGRRSGHIRMMRSMGRNNEILYTDLNEGTQVSQRDFMDKKFLIDGTPKTYAWKITGKQMKFGEYVCMEATYTDTAKTVKVWFTPQIPLSTGPADFGGLPGTILAVDINEGERTITAIEINMRELEASEMTKPTKGKKVTEEEYRAIVKEKMKEIREQNGGGRRVFVH